MASTDKFEDKFEGLEKGLELKTIIELKATICWNYVFHQKNANMECGWAGHYHYPL